MLRHPSSIAYSPVVLSARARPQSAGGLDAPAGSGNWHAVVSELRVSFTPRSALLYGRQKPAPAASSLIETEPGCYRLLANDLTNNAQDCYRTGLMLKRSGGGVCL